MRSLRLLYLGLFFSLPASASVSEIFAEMFGRPDRGGVKATYGIQQYETQPIEGTSHKLSLRQHKAEASVPLSSLSDKKWKLLLNAEADEYRSAARFPSGRPVPTTLWEIGAGLSHTRMLEGDRTVAGSFLLGSSGDEPFKAFRDLSFQANLAYKIPLENESAWIFLLSFANNRSFMNYIPLPGVAYFFRAHSRLRIAAGIPFLSVFWTPFDKAVFNLMYFPVYSAQAKFSYFLFGPAHIYIQAKYQTRNHFLSDRIDKRERFFYEEAVASTGLVMPIEQHAMLDFTAGYTLDRKLFVGRKSSSRGNGEIRRPDDSAFVSLRLITGF